jgi:hypothetical protein
MEDDPIGKHKAAIESKLDRALRWTQRTNREYRLHVVAQNTHAGDLRLRIGVKFHEALHGIGQGDVLLAGDTAAFDIFARGEFVISRSREISQLSTTQQQCERKKDDDRRRVVKLHKTSLIRSTYAATLRKATRSPTLLDRHRKLSVGFHAAVKETEAGSRTSRRATASLMVEVRKLQRAQDNEVDLLHTY